MLSLFVWIKLKMLIPKLTLNFIVHRLLLQAMKIKSKMSQSKWSGSLDGTVKSNCFSYNSSASSFNWLLYVCVRSFSFLFINFFVGNILTSFELWENGLNIYFTVFLFYEMLRAHIELIIKKLIEVVLLLNDHSKTWATITLPMLKHMHTRTMRLNQYLHSQIDLTNSIQVINSVWMTLDYAQKYPYQHTFHMDWIYKM